MIHLQVNYRIRRECLSQAEREIATFVDALRATRPAFERYDIFRVAGDDAGCLHVISFPDHEAHLRHTQSAHVKTFVENMLGLCETGPVYRELENVVTLGNGAGGAKS